MIDLAVAEMLATLAAGYAAVHGIHGYGSCNFIWAGYLCRRWMRPAMRRCIRLYSSVLACRLCARKVSSTAPM